VMYSGNHGPSNPIATLLRAAERLADDDRLRFLFVGGGVGKRAVAASTSRNVTSLPYQPLATLQYSLSAADIHAVTMGDTMVGIVHPCKVYGAMAVGRPILLFGPESCHVMDIVNAHGVGWRIAHGDVDGAVHLLRRLASMPPDELERIGRRAQAAAQTYVAKRRLCGALVDALEGADGEHPASLAAVRAERATVPE
jgi:colanic acid biosynthesis glycosyl transferase WcaI